MPKRILKDIHIDRKSNDESIITVSIWSSVPYLDKNFVELILNGMPKEEVTIDSKGTQEIMDELRKEINEISEKYDEPTPQMDEHEIFLASISKQISEDIVSSCIVKINPIIFNLVGEINKAKRGETPKDNMQNHIINITQLIDLMKSHLAYIPTLRERDKLMFQILEDIKMYAILGDKFLNLENFSTFWKLREEIQPTNAYEYGVKSRSSLPQPR